MIGSRVCTILCLNGSGLILFPPGGVPADASATSFVYSCVIFLTPVSTRRAVSFAARGSPALNAILPLRRSTAAMYASTSFGRGLGVTCQLADSISQEGGLVRALSESMILQLLLPPGHLQACQCFEGWLLYLIESQFPLYRAIKTSVLTFSELRQGLSRFVQW